MTPEGKIKRLVDAGLKKRKVWYFCPQAGPYGVRGIPDRIAIVNGQFLGIECKADATKKLTPLQARCRDDIKAAGGIYRLVCDDESARQLFVLIDYIMKDV